MSTEIDEESNEEAGYVKRYRKIEHWFRSHQRAYDTLTFLYRYLSWIIAGAYGVLILYCFISKDAFTIVKIITVPLTAFIVVSVLRYCMDFQRPYTKYPINPLIYKDKKGESMPSRHMLSITVIAMVWCYVYMPVGILLWGLSFVMGMIRVLAGVHFPRDIVVAALISAAFGYVGLWMF